MSEIVYSRTHPGLGRFALRAVDPAADAALLWNWLTHPKSVFWEMGEASLSDVRRQFESVAASERHRAYLGSHEQRPAFLTERYDPGADPVGEVYPVRSGDVGMHFLVAPTTTPIAGFSNGVLVTVLAMLFADPAVTRVVVEPDVANHAVHRRNAEVGFEVLDTVSLPGKQALLSACTREQFETATECRQPTGDTA